MYITISMYTLNPFDLLVALVLQLPGAFAGLSASGNEGSPAGHGASAASPNRKQAKRQQEF
jgi:hypothetical protein